MQLTNIARDVLEDANMGRRYIPEEWLSNSISVTEIAIGKSDIKKTIADAIKKFANALRKILHQCIRWHKIFAP
ncbi:MAG: hypothetical protein CM15mP51_10020 [Porticoccaceae bacterium]|nr:MAG: hypothetical protein CM15mP51_10020 [Porticoccaceae bacterium]